MPQLFLTGATGFVGRNLVIRALRDGWDVVAAVRDEGKLQSQLRAEGLGEAPVTAVSCNPSRWTALRPDLAVLSAGVLFARDRKAYFRTNVDWNLEIIRALPKATKLIVLSSQSAGGPTSGGLPARVESTPDAPVTWYGESKLALESALGSEFPDRKITILRPPMILGARDAATLPLFKMARGLVRMKPGLREKRYTFLAVDDVVEAILAAAALDARGPFYIGSDRTITDTELLATAARVANGRGITLPIPQPFIRLFAALVDAVPSMREATPSLTRDRAREIWADRWIVDSTVFRSASGWKPRVDFEQAMQEAFDHYQSTGQL